jgi:2-keto-4-pentenoate hydratase/2-oxohepta-3-ene-1,7-dioic acid hydratase in catechol pathway
MKLFRHGAAGEERPGIVDANGGLRDLTGHVEDIDGAALSPASLTALGKIDPATLPLLDPSVRIGPCVGSVKTLLGIGLNFADHAAEAGQPAPSEPILFGKSVSSICGPTDDIEIPRGSKKTDWEIELGVVIGKRTRYVDEKDALDHVAGYCTVNDVSERSFQFEGTGHWIKGKSHDTFGPIGPYMVTADEVPDPQDLHLWCEIDGVMRQNGTTATMIFPVRELVAFVSRFMTLEPGDILATGTPPGVGLGIKPEPVFLRAGQTLRCGVDGLGEQTHLMVDA